MVRMELIIRFVQRRVLHSTSPPQMSKSVLRTPEFHTTKETPTVASARANFAAAATDAGKEKDW